MSTGEREVGVGEVIIFLIPRGKTRRQPDDEDEMEEDYAADCAEEDALFLLVGLEGEFLL